MKQLITKHTILLSAFFFCWIACNPEATQESPKAPIAPTISSNIPIGDLSQFFDPQEIKAITKIKQVFDEGLKATSKNREVSYLYEGHAQRMRMDFFNKYPYTLNYPYNDKFDLSLVEEEIPYLSFLTKKCGFQKKEDDSIIHYYCLKKEGTFINFMEALGKDNPLIANLHRDYIEKKHISQNVRQQLLMNSYEGFDFQKLEHQLVYMFYQILINEERLAADEI